MGSLNSVHFRFLSVFILWVFIPYIQGCQLGLRTASRRGIEGLVRAQKEYQEKARQLPAVDERAVADGEVTIERNAQENKYYTGSLYTSEHGYSDLYAEFKTPRVGDFLDVKILAAAGNIPPGDEGAPPVDPAADPAVPAEEGAAGATDPDLAEILAGLPHLEPSPDSPTKLLESIRMRIDAVRPDGTLLVSYKRRSSNPYQKKEIEVRASVPYDTALSGENLTTNDLRNVEFFDDTEGFYARRESLDWQDEYSLRLSGFTEARSVYAKNLDDQREQVKQMKKNIEQKAVSMGQERRAAAAERSRLLQQNGEQTRRIQELENQLGGESRPAPIAATAEAGEEPVANLNNTDEGTP